MRGVVAKRLQRAAQKATVGQPERQLVVADRGALKGAVQNHPGTTRAQYRALKHAYRSLRR